MGYRAGLVLVLVLGSRAVGHEQVGQRHADGLHDRLGGAAAAVLVGVVAVQQGAAVIAAPDRQVASPPVMRRAAADPLVAARRSGVKPSAFERPENSHDGIVMISGCRHEAFSCSGPRSF